MPALWMKDQPATLNASSNWVTSRQVPHVLGTAVLKKTKRLVFLGFACQRTGDRLQTNRRTADRDWGSAMTRGCFRLGVRDPLGR